MQEEDFRTRLDAELEEELGPPIGTLVADATADGARRRRRRSIVQFTSGTLGVAAVVAGAAFAAGHVGRDRDGAVGAQTAPVKPVSSATTPPGPPSSAASTPWPVTSHSGNIPTEYDSTAISDLPPVPAGQARTTQQSMLLLLEQNVTDVGGAGEFTHTQAYAPDGSPQQTQRTTFMADLYWNHSTIGVRYTLPPKHLTKKAAQDPAGDVYRWNTPGVAGSSEVKLQKSARGVEVTYPDGSKVVVLEINGRELGTAGPDRPDLPLTSDQLLTIARDRHWAATMSADFVAQAATAVQVEAY